MFQSSPDPKAGCYIARVGDAAGVDPVSILTRPEGRVLRAVVDVLLGHADVSILTRPEGRVLPTYKELFDQYLDVSILTRPEGRVLRYHRGNSRTRTQFQSSPDPKAGCYRCLVKPELRLHRVSILTRPEGRVLRVFIFGVGAGADVSILTRPEGRVLLSSAAVCPLTRMFQSSPDPKAGCYQGPGVADDAWIQVSILTRPEGRVLPASKSSRASMRRRFNPHPTRRPGATLKTCKKHVNLPVFQSSPDPKAGCYFQGGIASPLAWGFQSSPDPKAGCYMITWEKMESTGSFNPHPTRRPGATLCAGRRLPRHAGFNPHPTRRPGATYALAGGFPDMLVSILTRPEGRVLQRLICA